jgi:hypothetical protein
MSRIISMKVKAALAGAALAGIGFAGSAMAGPPVNSGQFGDGDLFLVVFDSTQGTSYVEDLGVTTGAVASDSAVDTATGVATGGHLSTALPGYSATFQPDSVLSSYLGAHSGDTFQWEVIADATANSNVTAQNILLTTASKPISSTFTDSSGGGMSGAGGTVDSNAGNLQGDVGIWQANSLVGIANGVNANSSATTAFTTNKNAPGESLDQGALTWYGGGDTTPAVTWVPSGGTSSSNFYLATDATNNNNPAALADIFNLGTASLSASGVLSFAPLAAVPLPAAVWLFGSGLLGLAGVARRRSAAA